MSSLSAAGVLIAHVATVFQWEKWFYFWIVLIVHAMLRSRKDNAVDGVIEELSLLKSVGSIGRIKVPTY